MTERIGDMFTRFVVFWLSDLAWGCVTLPLKSVFVVVIVVIVGIIIV
jgi:hypothetical protein